MTLLANSPSQVEFQVHSREQTAEGIGLYVNADKTEYMCFHQKRDIYTLNGSSLKLVDKFTYLGSCISFTESDTNKQLAKVWTTIDRLLIILKSTLSNEIKGSFFFKQESSQFHYTDEPDGWSQSA